MAVFPGQQKPFYFVRLGSKRDFSAQVMNGRCRTKTYGQNLLDKYGRF